MTDLVMTIDKESTAGSLYCFLPRLLSDKLQYKILEHSYIEMESHCASAIKTCVCWFLTPLGRAAFCWLGLAGPVMHMLELLHDRNKGRLASVELSLELLGPSSLGRPVTS